jgi:hypothetical protein
MSLVVNEGASYTNVTARTNIDAERMVRSDLIERLAAKGVSVSLVVAHHSEDLTWLLPYASITYVYSKSATEAEHPLRDRFKSWAPLPNVGLEPHTYLHHLATHYDSLTDVVVFLKGHFTDPPPHRLPSVDDYIRLAYESEWASGTVGYVRFHGRIEHHSKWADYLNTGQMRAATPSLDEFYRSVVGRTPPPVSLVTYHGLFATSRARLLRYTRTQYAAWRDSLDEHRNPELGHYFERIWYTLYAIGV